MGLTSAALVFVFCACGTGLTLYVMHVQNSKLEDSSYRAFCDVDDTIACSEYLAEDKAMKQLVERVMNVLGVPYNPTFSPHHPSVRFILFPLICLLGCLPFKPTIFLATLLSSLASFVSAYLLYMLFYVTNQICLPCIAIYFFHLSVFVLLTARWAGGNSAQKAAKPSHKRKASDKTLGETSERETTEDEASLSTDGGKESSTESSRQRKNKSEGRRTKNKKKTNTK